MSGGDVTLTIDGVTVSVPPGTNVVDAAHRAGIEIPIFCHHPRLEPVGMCRMCLVEVGTPVVDRATGEVERDAGGEPVIRFFPKLTAGCTTPVSQGMVVRTDTDGVAEARRSVLEFLLTSHPLDCPVCDKGGECPLQNLTMRYGPGESRFSWGGKYHFEKPVPIGPLIVLDRERCVLCARCIRFEEELADDAVLGFANRGRGMEIVSFSDPPFASYFSGNTTDVCPVGALTTRDFRFQARAWEVFGQPGVCTHCPVGCNVMYDTRHRRIERVMPRENDAVNEIWLCDKGRFAHHYASAEGRLTTPLVRRDGALEPASWDEALTLIAARLGSVREAHGPAAIGGLTGDSLPNEDLYLFGRFARAVLGTNNVDHRPGVIRDDTVVRAGVGAGTCLTDLGRGTAIVAAGLDVEEEAPVLFLNLLKGVRAGAKLVVLGGRPGKIDRHADAVLRYRYGGEDTAIAALLRAVLDQIGDAPAAGAEGLRAAVAPYDAAALAGMHPIRPEDLDLAATAIAGADDLLVLFGRDAAAAGLIAPLAALVTATGHVGRARSGLVAVGPHANSQGAADMGLMPAWLPGYRDVDDPAARAALAEVWPGPVPEQPGLDAAAMLGGGVKALLVLGTNPLGDDPGLGAALDALDFLAVQELYLTETARRADVVLPLQSVPERDGTLTNMTRRVQRFGAAVAPVGESRPGWSVLRDLSQRFGIVEPFDTAADVMAEIARAVPAYAGLTHEALGPPPSPAPTATLLPFAPISEPRHVTYHGTAYSNAYGVGAQWPLDVGAGRVAEDEDRGGDSVEPDAGERGGEARDTDTAGGAANGDPGGQQAAPLAEPDDGLVGTGAGLDWRPGDGAPHDGLVLVPTTRLYDDGALMRPSTILAPLVPEPHVVMSPFDARPLGLDDGARVRVASVHGALEAPVRLGDGLTPGVVLIPDGLAWETPVRTLLGGAHVVPVTVEAVGS